MTPNFRWIAWLLLATLASNTAICATPPTATTTLAFQPCRLTHPSRLASYAAECASLSVAENPAVPNRRITLSIARIRAVSGRKAQDPLFLIAGGPGMGTQEMYTALAGAFARIRRDRDIILLDQRGTGHSTPLLCPDDGADALEASDVKLNASATDAKLRQCLTQLQREHDVAQYTTSVAVKDLEAVRAALGYPSINLYGVSCGTRVAQHYLRRYPQAVRSVILDGVIAHQQALGGSISLDAEAALQQILQRCTQNSACHQAFPDLATSYQKLQAALARKPQEIRLSDPTSGASRSLLFGPRQLAAALRLTSYNATQAAMLPLAINEAQQKENYTPFAGMFLMSVAALSESIAIGMNNSVICSEDLPYLRDKDIDQAKIAATYLGSEPLDAMRHSCAIWPRGPVDAGLRSPLKSDTPVLLLSGSDDPATPTANAALAMKQLSQARHLVLKGEGHGQITAHCMDRIMADFVGDLSLGKLDVVCLEKRQTPAFFISLAGPAP